MKKANNWRHEYVVIEPSKKQIKELESGFSVENNLDILKILKNSKRKVEVISEAVLSK
jgi:hypothetical protein